MRYIKSLENMFFSKFIHRIDRTDPINKKSLIIYPTKTLESLMSFINDANDTFENHLALTDVNVYFVPRRLDFNITNMRAIEAIDQNKNIMIVKNNCPSIEVTPITTDNIASRNMILDMVSFTNLLFSKVKVNEKVAVTDTFVNLKNYIDKYTADLVYENKYLIFNLDETAENLINATSIKENDYKTQKSLYFYFFYMLKYFRDELFRDLSGYNVLFISKKGIVKFNINEIRDELANGTLKDNFINILLLRISMAKSGIDVGKMMDEINDANSSMKYKLKKDEVEDDINDIVEKEKIENKTMNQVLSKIDDKTKDKSHSMDMIDQYVKTVAMEQDDDKAKKAEKIMSDIKDNMIGRQTTYNPKEKKYMDNMKNISVNGKPKNDLVDAIRDMKIEKEVFNVTTVGDMNENSFINFDRTYTKTLREVHLKKIGEHFSSCDVPLYLVDDVKIEDVSNELDLIDEVKYKYKDAHGIQQTVTLNVPRLTRGGFLWLGGQKMTLANQLSANPIVKIGEDVIITGVYNKVFMTYKGSKYLTPNQSRMIRAIEKLDKETIGNTIVFGDYSDQNLESGKTTAEYISMSKLIIGIKTAGIDFTFRIDESIKKYGDHYKEGYLVLGTYGGKEIRLNIESDTVSGDESIEGLELMDAIIKMCKEDNKMLYDALMSISDSSEPANSMSISDLLIELSKTEMVDLYDALEKIKTIPTSLASTHIKIMNRWIPLIYVLMHTHGFFSTLSRAKIHNEVRYKIDIKADGDGRKRPKFNKYKQMYIETSDAFVIFDLDSLENVALLAPLNKLDLKSYKLAALENKDYTTCIIEQYGDSTNLPNYIDTFKNGLIDPLTKECLEDHNLPTDFLDVMLYANMLLSTGKSTTDIDMGSKKLRHAEIITALTYQVLNDAYNEYAIKKKRGNKKDTISVDKNAVIKELYKLNTTSGYSSINPIEERSELTQVTMKGHRGSNLEQSYDLVKRSFDTSHYGLIGLPSNYGPGVGVIKYLTFDPNIISPKGYIKTINDLSEVQGLKSQQMLTSTELLIPGISKNDDPQRQAMAVGQSNQILPLIDSDVNLVTYGYDEILPHLTEDFAFSTIDSGVVTGIDDDFISVKYKDGSTEVHKLARLERNAAKSFYTVNRIDIKKGVKVGYKFKKGEILAYNKYFFKDVNGVPTFSDGPSALVLIHSAPEVFEDSTIISESFAKRIGTFITKRYDIKMGTKNVINSYKKRGAMVKSTEVLMSFNKVTEDDFLNEFLGESSSKFNRIDKKNKIAGEIVSIRIYYSCKLEDLHPTILSFVKEVNAELLPKEKLLIESGTRFDKAVDTELPMKVPAGTKKNGTKIEDNEVLIEYYVRSFNIASIGDKVAYMGALKGITAKVLPDDMMPMALTSNRRVDCILRTVSLGARKVYSVPIIGVNSKALSKLGKDLQDLFKDE